jgi:hypothetical protein
VLWGLAAPTGARAVIGKVDRFSGELDSDSEAARGRRGS